MAANKYIVVDVYEHLVPCDDESEPTLYDIGRKDDPPPLPEPHFTPGPWHAHHGACEPDYVYFGKDENCDVEHRVIAEVYQRINYHNYDVDLIKAAPLMYNTLAILYEKFKKEGGWLAVVADEGILPVLQIALGEGEVSDG